MKTKGTLLDEHTGGRPKMNAGFGSEWDTLYKRGKITDTPPLCLPYKQVEMLHTIYTETVKFRDTYDRQMAQGIK
jgi:hypothetical protein